LKSYTTHKIKPGKGLQTQLPCLRTTWHISKSSHKLENSAPKMEIRTKSSSSNTWSTRIDHEWTASTG